MFNIQWHVMPTQEAFNMQEWGEYKVRIGKDYRLTINLYKISFSFSFYWWSETE